MLDQELGSGLVWAVELVWAVGPERVLALGPAYRTSPGTLLSGSNGHR